MRTSMTALLLVLAVAACRREPRCLGGGRSVTLGMAQLDTEYDRDHAALFHIYLVPQWPQPSHGGHGASAAHSGSPRRQTIEWTFYAGATIVKSSPVSFVDCTRIEAGGHAYDIAKGNVFVASVSPDGSLQVKQLPHVLSDNNPSPGEVLEFIKREGG